MKLTQRLYVSPVKDRNEEKYGHMTNQCICCMKPLKDDDAFQVHMNTDWMAVNPTVITEENCGELTGAESQGAFKIGNDCAKKMKGFAYKFENGEIVTA